MGGCASWLPEARTDVAPFESFEAARAAIEAILPMQSRRSDIDRLGFNPDKHPNARLLGQTEVIRRFLPSTLLQREDIDPGIWTCLKAGAACRGFEITSAKLTRERKGNFLADFFNFKRRTETRGWRITAVILLIDDLVVYRGWSGQPNVNETVLTDHPLGPFQDIEPAPAN